MQSFAENAAIAGNSPAGGAEIKSQWQNKRIAFLGDSITDKCHVGTIKNYWQYLEEILGIKPAVYGINGDNFCGILKQAKRLKSDGAEKNRRNHDIRRDKRLQRQRSNRAMVQIRRSRSSNCKRQNANPQAQNPHNGFIYVQRPDKCGNGVHQRKFPRQTDYINYANTPRIRKVRRRKCSAGRIISQ